MEVEDQDYAETGGSGVMVSNLPLLFSRGSPSSLCDMSQSELEVFVPFMVRCSVGEERPVPWSHLPRPPWWPKKLPFRMPISRNALMGLVERCYSFHGCDYLLQFCASLVAQMPPTGYRFNDNRDGTTSMYHGTTGKLLVTFRNENREYDKYRHDGKGRDATKKLLLSSSSHSGGGGSGVGGVGGGSTAMIQPPVTDIYLCDKCENEFYSLKEVQAHERQCCGEAPSTPPTSSPEPEVAEEEPEPAGQVPFLSYFNLCPAQHTGLQPYMSPRKKSVSNPPAKLPGPIYPRYDSIALTSPLGRYLFSNSKFRNKYQASQHSVMRYERHLHATPNTDVNYRERCTSRWIVVWRSRKEQQPWVHIYCFNRIQRREQMITIRTGLNRESRRLLRLCRPLSVRTKQLPKRMVDRLMRLGGPTSAPCIDLTDEHNLEAGQLLPRPLDPRISWLGSGGSVGQQFSVQLQWLTGLPPDTTSMCLPGSSGSSGLRPHYTGQVGLAGLNVGHHSSLNLIPLVAGNAWQQQQQQQVPASSVSSRPLVTNNSHFKVSHQGLVQRDGAGPSPDFPLPADISLVPLGVPGQPTRSQLEADLMKPLSRKKFPAHGHLRPSVIQMNRKQQGSRVAMAFPAPPPQSLAPPQPPDWERVVPAASSQRDGLSHTLASSSIEIIDLSSDEDDYSRSGRGRNKAANAPQQLDGLACYPHTGAKMPPESSEFYSLSKNGNSHWSSQQKSHCGAGRVGDLATNGQPPNVLPSNPDPSPAPWSQGPHVKGNSRKRKSEGDPPFPSPAKTIILDISSQGVTVSEERGPLTSECFKFGLPQRETLGAMEGAGAPPTSIPCCSYATACTNYALESSNSLIIDEDVSFKTPIQIDEEISFSIPQVGPQESGRICSSETPDSLPGIPAQQSGQSLKFLTQLMAKGVKYVKSLVMGKESQTMVSTGSPAALESQSQAQQHDPTVATAASSYKRFKRVKGTELRNLLKDECRELQRSGLEELSHLDLHGVRLTRRALGRILPGKPSRKTFGPRLRENRPPHRHSTKARREEVRGGQRGAVGQSTLGLKGPAHLRIDENGNSASYVQAGPKQQEHQTARHCFGSVSRVQNGAVVTAPPEASREWRKVVPGLPCVPVHSDWNKKLSNDSVLGKSTVFSDISLGNCEALENSCNGVWVSSVASKVEHKTCSTGLKTIVSHMESEGEERDVLPSGGTVTFKQANGQARCKEQPVCGAKGNVGDKLSMIWDAGGSKRLAGSHYLGKNVLAHGQTPALAQPEVKGKTAEECGAQLAQCPLPEQLQHYPADSGTPPPPPPKKPRLSLLACIRKGHSSPTQHDDSPPAPDQKPHSFLQSPAKPHSTNNKKRSSLNRELSSLACDEWKEIRGTGFHPSDLVGCEGVKYFGVSSDEDETPSPSAVKLSATDKRRPLLYSKVSLEVARLLRDECKELRGPRGHLPKSHKDKVRRKCAHPLAGRAGLELDNGDLLGVGGGSRCSTRSRVNTQAVGEVFTPRDSHRHLLQSEVAMCVLNYKLPNIH